MIPLTKCLDPADYTELADTVAICRQFDLAAGQHPHRLWEYALGLLAIWEWQRTRPVYAPVADATAAPFVADVGGAGSRYCLALQSILDWHPLVIDPQVNWTLERAQVADIAVLTAVSVIEHVADPKAFLRAGYQRLRPGGLFYLTTDCWNCEGPDTTQFHGDRARIYTPESWKKLGECARKIGFRHLGACDWRYHGDHVYNYTFASMALVKPAINAPALEEAPSL